MNWKRMEMEDLKPIIHPNTTIASIPFAMRLKKTCEGNYIPFSKKGVTMYGIDTSMQTDIEKMIKEGAHAAMSLEEIIQLEVSDWLTSKKRKGMRTGEEYYRNQNAIRKRERKVIGEGGIELPARNLANAKLASGFIRKLVDQKVGYLLSKPMSMQTEPQPYQEKLDRYFGFAFQRLLQSIGTDALNKGIGWMHIYYDEEGQFRMKRMSSEQIVPLWKDRDHTELFAIARVYDVEGYEGKRKTLVTKVEYWDERGVRRYIKQDNRLSSDYGYEEDWQAGHFAIANRQVGWGRVPFIPFKSNSVEMPLVEALKDLVDDYDLHKSNLSNVLQDNPNRPVYVLKNYDGTDLGEFRHNLNTYGAIKITDPGGVEVVTAALDVEAMKAHQKSNRRDIYKFGRGVDTQAEAFQGDKSGVALKFLYADLDMDANMMEAEFQWSLQQLVWFINRHLEAHGEGSFADDPVTFLFSGRR